MPVLGASVFLILDKIKKNAGNRTCTHTILRPQAPEACASANSAIPAFFQPACFALFAPLVDCSLIITQEWDNVNRKIQKN